MALSPTVEALHQKLIDNSGFEAERDLAKAREYLTAATALLSFSPEEMEDQHKRLKFDLVRIENNAQRARQIINAYDTSGRRRFGYQSFEYFRG